jgi:branched-chain amino acid transport system substrate-binding protein
VRSKLFRSKMAVPVVLMGMAFFMISCQAVIPVKKEVQVDKTPVSLHRQGDIYLKNGQYKEALGLYKRLVEEYPTYRDLPTVGYQIARSLYLINDYDFSRDETVKWLEKYPRHPLKREVLLLTGENFKALGDNPRAFVFWLKAGEECAEDIKCLEKIREKRTALIKEGKIEAFEALSGYAGLSDYAPKAYNEMIGIFLESDQPEKAEKVAKWLAQSTAESWALKGRESLEQIRREINVRPEVVGCLLPLSGPFAIYGQEVLNGIQLGMGMFGEPGQSPALELVIKDTEGKPEKAKAGLEDLVNNEKVVAVIGPLTSRTAMDTAREAQTLGVPIIALTQKEGVTELGDMIFRNFLTPEREVRILVRTAINEMGKNRFAILYPNNPYGRFFMNLFWDTLDEMGGIVTAVESYNPDDTDFPDEIKKMTGLYYPRPVSLVERLEEMRTPEEEESTIFPDEPKPIIDFDAIFLPDIAQRVAMIAPQLVYHDVTDVLLMGTSLWQSPQLLETASDYIQGAIFPSGFFEKSGEPGVENFVEKYKENFESSPGTLAAIGYDTVRLIKYVMEHEGARTRMGLKRALFRCPDFAGVTGMIYFDYRGELAKEPILLTVSGNKTTLFR